MSDFLSQITPTTVITLLGFGGAIWVFWRNGTTRASAEVINLYKIQVDQLKDEVRTLREQISSLTQQVGHLQGEVGEKDKKIKDYLGILQNRNPELEGFIRLVSEVATAAKGSMALTHETNAIVKKLSAFLTEGGKDTVPHQ